MNTLPATLLVPFGRRMPHRPGTVVGAVLMSLMWLCVCADGSSAAARGAPGGTQRNLVEVAFAGCSELAGITRITVPQARSVVPASFALSGDAGGVPFVVRVAHCAAMSIDGNVAESGTVAQLGVSIVSPDGTGDINNYLAWYDTTSKRLAQRLRRLGVRAKWVPRLHYHLAFDSAHTGGVLKIAVSADPAFDINAPVVNPDANPVPFTANWWVRSGRYLTKMSTPIPALRFGIAHTTLRTPAASRLDRVLGEPTETFALLDTFNRFPAARMTVSVTPDSGEPVSTAAGRWGSDQSVYARAVQPGQAR